MRELYACQLDLRESAEASSALDLIQEWVARGSGLDLADVRRLGASTEVTSAGHQLYNALPDDRRTDAREWTCSWRRPDERDPAVNWRILVATGPSPEEESLVRVSLRIRIERADDSFQLAPLQHSFRAPAVIRTLLREHEFEDAGARVNPTYAVRRAADVPSLVARLRDPDRRLPIIIVTRGPGPTHSIDAGELARAVAGLAQVEVLSTHLAALALTDELGREASVWGGAVRMYWPQLVGSDLHRHRYWTRSHLELIRDFSGMLLTSLGSLAAARVPEHPVVALARARNRPKEASEESLPDWAEAYIEAIEQDLATAQSDADESRAALADALQIVSDLEADLVSVRAAFSQVAGYEPAIVAEEDSVDIDKLDVGGAFELAKKEASEHIVYLNTVESSVADFGSYKLPRRLYEALTAISEAAEAWHDGTLGAGFGDFFSARGYEYSKTSPAANAKKTKSHYRRQYEGATVVMEPHLKVDQSTTADQCLRIYWYRDEAKKKIVVGHVGRHLPD